jgi:hypothetical protein
MIESTQPASPITPLAEDEPPKTPPPGTALRDGGNRSEGDGRSDSYGDKLDFKHAHLLGLLCMLGLARMP